MDEPDRADACAVCDAGLGDTAATIALPRSWIILLHERGYVVDEAPEFQPRELESAFIRVCEECEPRANHLRLQSWATPTPDRLDNLTRSYVGRIHVGRIFEGRTAGGDE